MMSQMNNTLKPVAEVTAVLPPGTPEMQRQHIVTTLQTIVAQQLQINPAQSPVILQTLQQLQQLYDLRATLQTAATIPSVVSAPPTPAQPTPSLDPAALALLSGVFTTGAGAMQPQPVAKPAQPAAHSRPVVSQSLAQDLMSYGLIKGGKGNDHSSAPPKKTASHGDRPSFKNPESLRK